jgi:hypothetical protein
MQVISKLKAGSREITAAEVAHLDAVFRREREMELVLARERHRKLRKLRETVQNKSIDGLGAPVMEMDTWLSGYLNQVLGTGWQTDKTALRMLRNEMPELFSPAKGTRIQSGYRGDGGKMREGEEEQRGVKFRKVYA